ncbi:MAG: GIY-YIG nuclease family protein [Gammaproteobacteria bacterium]|nr:GIY-YIG nuclease family protein [Gammaproteobacteria bacterium]NIQ12375.1 GIY-YIG nuclease family protein [Gammaproteobacteria bacterium]NIQ75214.1 GIY-YIG nuclease family protein [Gammaproteobacteria bacterium]NIR26245.1 GIY-YIG nuclease family protein [Gammaproteobacteria bacterium]NIR96071.1 GIY-YIG nuclease family protein [Gammaproteobacteria bacterium]
MSSIVQNAVGEVNIIKQNIKLEGFPDRMVLLDCETTGSIPGRDRLTEIALIEIEKGEVIDQWQTLINPGITIPAFITRLTGISNEMVADAPSFHDIARELKERLENKVLVAHNIRFDYSFIKQAFSDAGIEFAAQTLCSVKLSRKFYPSFKRHRLDDIINRLQLTISGRHRAMTDTSVILSFFERISMDFDPQDITAVCKHFLNKPSIPSQLHESEVTKLPNTPGTYRFYSENGNLLYVGKSVTLRTRVLSHFSQNLSNSREMNINRQVHHIDYDKTPSDFGALLLENLQIKLLSPTYNRRQRRQRKLYQFELTTDELGYIKLHLALADMTKPPAIFNRYGLFRSKSQAINQLKKIAGKHRLCHRLLGLEKKREGACFAYQLKKCPGSCCGKETATQHNLRLELAIQELKNLSWPWSGPVLVIEQPLSGNYDDTHYHLVDQWIYLGRVKNDAEALERWWDSRNDPVSFDLDTYQILLKFLLSPQLQKVNRLRVLGFKQETRQVHA